MRGVRGVFHLGAASKVLPSLKNPQMGTFNVERNSVGTSRVLEARCQHPLHNLTFLTTVCIFIYISIYTCLRVRPREGAVALPRNPIWDVLCTLRAGGV